MTKRAMSTGGYPIEVMTPTDPVTIPAATTSAIGGVKKMTNQAASTATDVAGVVTMQKEGDLIGITTKGRGNVRFVKSQAKIIHQMLNG